jgi:D-alanyl-D-alanine carboxypeptidase
MRQRAWEVGIFVPMLVLLLGIGCSGDSGRKASGEGKHTDGGSEQASTNDLDAALKKSFKESDAPGVVAGVQTSEYTWVRALGVADRATREPMTPEVHHRIGSVTKTFTATLLLQAADEGLLSLDDTIDQYVKGVPNGEKITLRQMSDMTSGIASYTEDDQWVKEWSSDPTRVWAPQELARIGIKESPLFDPGTEWFYSNTNYVLLGLLLEKVTGKPIGQLYQKEIIEPLDLEETSFPNKDSALPEPYDHGYTLQGKSSGEKPIDSTHWSPSEAWTAGEMISTVDDLLVYGRALGTGKGLLPPEQQSERLDSFVSDVPPLKGDLAYGIGLGKDHGWIGHNGEIPGYNTYLFYHPDLDAVVAVEVNSDISSGKCPKDVLVMKECPQSVPCELPADRIFEVEVGLMREQGGEGLAEGEVVLNQYDPEALGCVHIALQGSTGR